MGDTHNHALPTLVGIGSRPYRKPHDIGKSAESTCPFVADFVGNVS